MMFMWKKQFLPILVSILSGIASLSLWGAEAAPAASSVVAPVAATETAPMTATDLEQVLAAAMADSPALATVSPSTSISPTKSPESLGSTPDSITIQVPTRVTASPSTGLEFPGKPLVLLTATTSATLTKLVHQQMRYLARERNAGIAAALTARQQRFSRPPTKAQAVQLERYRQQLETSRVLPELETFAHITSAGKILFALVPAVEKAKVEEFALLPTEQAHKAHFIEKLRERYGRFNPPLELVQQPPQRGVMKVIPGWRPGELN